MRLFEAEVRADSITASASGVNFTTHASNFSLANRSAALPIKHTVSTPNWRKHSERIDMAGSFISTKAARAAALRVGGMGAIAVLKPLSMGIVTVALKLYSGLLFRPWQRRRRTIPGYRSAITSHTLGSDFRCLAEGSHWGNRRATHKYRRNRGLFRPAAEEQGSVGPAKTEGIRHGVFDLRLARLVGHEVHAGGLGVLSF